MKKKTVSLVVALIVTSSVIQMPVYATPTSNPTESQQTKDDKAEMAKFQKEISDQQKEIYKLNESIESLMDEKKKNESKVSEYNAEIEKIQKEIDAITPKVKEREKVLGKRLRELYKGGGATSYLAAFTGTQSVSEIIERMDSVNTVLNIDKKAMDEFNENQRDLKNKMKAIEKKKSEVSKIDLEIKKNVKVTENKKKDYDKFIKENEAKIDEVRKSNPELLAEYERKTVQPQFDIIDNPDSDYATIQGAVQQLTAIINAPNGNVTSAIVIQEINDYIAKGQGILDAIDQANSVATIGQNIVNTAYGYYGYPYVWGAKGPNAFDCSGFVQYVYGLNGYSIGGSTYSQINNGVPISYDEMMPGDIVFTNGLSHVGIYIGGGQYIHAANESLGVITSAIAYDGFYAARRVI